MAALSSASTNHVTELLARWSEGDAAAREALIAVVYPELRRLAGKCLACQQHQTLHPLLHAGLARRTANACFHQLSIDDE